MPAYGAAWAFTQRSNAIEILSLPGVSRLRAISRFKLIGETSIEQIIGGDNEMGISMKLNEILSTLRGRLNPI